MARGRWRDWSEVRCGRCPFRAYRKHFRTTRGRYVCPDCGSDRMTIVDGGEEAPANTEGA